MASVGLGGFPARCEDTTGVQRIRLAALRCAFVFRTVGVCRDASSGFGRASTKRIDHSFQFLLQARVEGSLETTARVVARVALPVGGGK